MISSLQKACALTYGSVHTQVHLHTRAHAYLRRPMEGVGVENGLDHDEGLHQVLPGKVVSVIGRLVRAVVKHLQERRPSKVEHELQAQRETQVHGAVSCWFTHLSAHTAQPSP